MKKIIAIIPARIGSKGLKKKNIKFFCGKPLVYWTIRSAQKSKLINEIFLSTDSNIIKKIGVKNGIKIPFLRPKRLASDNSKVYLTHMSIIKYYESRNIYFDYIVQLDPTSPIRLEDDIDNYLKFVIKEKIKSLVSISLCNTQHPNYLYRLNNNKKLIKFDNHKDRNIQRQNISNLYYPNGNFYCSEVSIFKKYKSFYNKFTHGYIDEKLKSFEIDDELDFEICEFLMKKKVLKK